MKRLSSKQKVWAVLGAGLLVAAASGSAFAMRTAEERDMRRIEIQQEKKSTTLASPLPTPMVQPTPESENEVEFTGPVEAMASDMWVVGGRTVAVTAATEIKSGLGIGTVAKVHAVRQADGSLLAREIEAVGNDDQGNSNSNGNEDNGNHNGNVNSNDENGNDDQGNVNSNDDRGNDDQGNVNSNGNVNANDDNGHDDHGGSGNANSDNSNDDHGGNSNDDHSGHGNDGHENGG